MKSEIPFFSIVIPTRNRSDTLKYTIETILKQNFTNFEIIICDNNSYDDTKNVAENFNDKRIQYIKSEKSLSMVDNWELAFTKVTGTYVTYLADNDGLINNSLSYLFKLLKTNNFPDIIRWNKNLYYWPCSYIKPNTLLFKPVEEIKLISSEEIITKIFNNETPFQSLPMIYNSIISTKLVNDVKKEYSRVFKSVCPDVYSGFIFALTTQYYLSLECPISIGGNSSKSTGTSYLNKKNNVEKEFYNLIEESEIKWNINAPNLYNIFSSIYETYLNVCENLNIKFSINYNILVENIFNTLSIHDQETLDKIIKEVERIKDINYEYFQAIQNKINKFPLAVTSFQLPDTKKGFYPNKNKYLELLGKDFNLNNIYDVSIFMSGFYDYSNFKIDFPKLTNTFEEIKTNSKIIIWGNGSLSKKTIINLHKTRPDCKIVSIIDSFNEEKDSLPPIKLPTNTSFENIDYLIIASSFLKEIIKEIDRLNIKKGIKILKVT